MLRGRIVHFLVFIIFGYLVVFSPSFDLVPWVFAKYDDKRVMELLLICVVLVAAIVRGNGDVSLNLVPCLIAALLVISSLLAEKTSHALTETALLVGLFYFMNYLRASWAEYREKLFLVVVICLWISAVIYLIEFYTSYVASILVEGKLLWPEPFSGFSSVRFFNQYQIWGLPLLAAPLLVSSNLKSKYKKIIRFLLAFWWVLLYASGSKGAVLAIGAALIATLLVYRQSSLFFIREMLYAGTGGLFLYGILFYAIPFCFSIETQLKTIAHTTEFARLELWARAIDMIKENPFFGVGPMHYAWYPNQIAAHPHNSVLQVAAEFGLITLLLLLWVSIYAIRNWIKRFNYGTSAQWFEKKWGDIPVVLFCSLAAGATYSLVSGVIVMPLSQVIGGVVVGMMMGVYCCKSGRKVDVQLDNTGLGKSSIYLNLRRSFAILTLITLVWTVTPQLLPRLVGQEALLPHSYHVLGPRFWQQGGIPH